MPLLEIEQKFSFTLANAAILSRKGGFPPFKTLGDFRSQTFRDTYYDSQNKLSNAGLWLRKRHLHADPAHPHTPSPGDAPEWEAKQSMQGGSFLRSTFSETRDRSRILELVRLHFPDQISGFRDDFGLDAIAGFETRRLTLLADEKFTVVLDVTDFGHVVGEVELMAEDAGEAHADIDAFFEEYAWFFDTSNPKGKLTAYFEKFGYPK
ncbi:hypothetical protein HO133_002090 [Letharia lupina]|uniref:CYTH domain-containing protein n=1 Tax=Letharia lupina TaxID=560253 RepID=A0A8H6CCU8_9LECA|nr:uncharacterized protein HO133_002090 [Letharia lupina]KAF6221235.1 hypothetical protein HO133_002090 [Letharia lupina]